MMKTRITQLIAIHEDGINATVIYGQGILNIEQTVVAQESGKLDPYTYAVATITPEEISIGPTQPAAPPQSDDLPSLHGEQAHTVREPSSFLGGVDV